MAKLLYSEEEAMTHGERLTAGILGDGLPDHWTVICNKMFTSNHGPTREIDFIVVGDGTIILIDEKSWKGRITGSDQIWSREDGSSHYNPLNKLDRTVRMMVGHLRDRVPHLNQVPEYVVFAIGCVSLTISDEKPKISHDIDPRLAKHVFLLKDAVADLIALDKSGWTEGVAKTRTDIVDVLWQIKSRPKSPTYINEFQIIEPLPSPPYPEVKRYLSQHPDGSQRVLTTYELTSLSDTNRQFYLREYEAFKTLGESGLTPTVDLWFEWSDGQFLVVPNEVPEGTSYGALRTPETRADVVDELYKCAAIYSALSLMHAKGIVHRTLGLENIYLQESDDGYGVTFTGLWTARQRSSSTGTIAQQLDEISEGASAEDPAAAPEIYQGYEFADETSDTYAISIMLLSRLSGVRIENLRSGTGEIIVSNSWDIWQQAGPDIASKLVSFFESTLGTDPAIDSGPVAPGRKSAEYCELEILDIISEANGPDDDERSSPLVSEQSLERVIPSEDIDNSHVLEGQVPVPADAGADQEALYEEVSGFSPSDAVADEPAKNHDSESDAGSESEPQSEPEIEENVPSNRYLPEEVDLTQTSDASKQESYPGTKAIPQEELFLRHGPIRLQIKPEGISIGRSAENELQISDDYVSNKHSRVAQEKSRFILNDMGSRNGTYINEERIEQAVLQPGDVIRIGRTDIYVESEFPSEVDTPSWKIILLSGPKDSSEFEVAAGTTSIGRGVDNDLVLASRSVSRVHADLILDRDGLEIEDKGSTNGTFVNNYRVSSSFLKNDDVIEMGDTKIRVIMD